MRPILLSIPSKPLFFIALALALGLFVRDLLRRRTTPGAPLTGNPLLLLVGASLLVRYRSPTASFIPEAGTFSQAWLPVPIYSYGVMLGTSMIVGWFIAMRFAKQDNMRTEDAGAIYMWSAIWSIVGARLLYVLTNLSMFAADPLEIVKVNNGGLVAYGGMIGGFLGSIYECRKRKVPLLQWVDVGAPSVVLGTGITRVGCLLFGCDFGARSDVPWAIRFPQGSPAWHQHVEHYGLARDAAQSFPVHPTQIYESLVGLGLFILLLAVRRYRRFSGLVFIAWVVGYGVLRPLIEVVRDDDQRGNVGPLSTSQFIGIVSVVLSIGLLIHLVRKYHRDPAGSQLWLRPLPAGGPDLSEADADRAPGAGGARRKKRR
ncbi:MAG TPA: prolipoprotein diacylglyceryl transferase [Polyangia bacterium]|nr:prolipoprotein diacylglyceryl transferase [Polyangia bacterium]